MSTVPPVVFSHDGKAADDDLDPDLLTRNK